MFTEVMVNAYNDKGYKWISYKEWLTDYLGFSPGEVKKILTKNQIKK